MINEEENCETCGKPLDQCECPGHNHEVETEAGNPSLSRFVAKRTRYTQ